jgi:cation:H+ antiporter
MLTPDSLTSAILFVIVGLVALAGGGEWLVRGAVATARHLRLSPIVIGLTIVAMATSLPELAVSLAAELRQGSTDVAIGNVVGSNMFNIAVILGAIALFFPPLFSGGEFRLDIAAMAFSAAMAVVVSRDGSVGHIEGFALLVMLVIFLAYRARSARNRDEEAVDEKGIAEELERAPRGLSRAIALIVAGSVVLTVGADIMVRGAVEIARQVGVSERVIALTLVSAGTGLPELATAIVAGYRRHAAVAVGNVIGSNIFNVFGILGLVSLVSPVEVSDLIRTRDMWWMFAFSLAVLGLALVPILVRGRAASRLVGLGAMAAYVVYLSTLL